MKLTRFNIESMMPKIRSIIDRAEFVGFDYEMTGISASKRTINSNTDTISMRYTKAVLNHEQFIPTQIGLCFFESEYVTQGKGYSAKKKKIYKAHPFNIHMFPFEAKGQNKNALLNAGALGFLAKHDFDFNSLVYEGVFYRTIEEANKVGPTEISYISTLHKKHVKNAIRTFEEDLLKSIKALSQSKKDLKKETIRITVNVKNLKIKHQYAIENLIKLMYDDCRVECAYNSQDFTDRTELVVELSQFSDALLESAQSANSEHSSESVKKLRFFNGLLKYRRIYDIPCLTQIVGHIFERNLPFVTHNGFNDMFHFYKSFIGEIPTTQEGFVKGLNEVAGRPMRVVEGEKTEQIKPLFKDGIRIYDTKFMANQLYSMFEEQNNLTQLGTVFKIMNENPEKYPDIECILPENCRYSLDGSTEAAHEAGYDALMTGAVFIKYLKMLNCDFLEAAAKGTNDDKKLTEGKKQQIEMIDSFMRNKLPLGGVKVPFIVSPKDKNSSLTNTPYHSDMDVANNSEDLELFHYYCDRPSFINSYIHKIIEAEFNESTFYPLFSSKCQGYFYIRDSEAKEKLEKLLNKFGGSYYVQYNVSEFKDALLNTGEVEDKEALKENLLDQNLNRLLIKMSTFKKSRDDLVAYCRKNSMIYSIN